ncbi:acyl-CoA dehydrogenase [Haematobacter massiliensis]|uniref:3-methylmercaptopropionyl-CoA dehydrogenase n=1 Tax=Haematobacter massiliensis TaxID=195105 RepID=A0A086YAM8_9RHOB|nr:acyl-CoA dehydrogenase C-terminal domain-containing protein [Haematobacter massiliensis]KFI31328.1 acyl-CoA dehydrogenase [Haematobacter massiliensis]OWJ73640.1 acyl-CoA dehydrogenase [Haematobacter massiliensis]OWJ87064.1 acyl-CoA dehydrogenase [Haematobacter massiliensis]QBJ23399.1 acyl-CoA dehydrogenase [Haematobacter massiliensis]
MTTYTPPIEDMQFLLHEVLKVTESDVPGYDELDRDSTAAILEEAGKLASEVLAPLNAVGDREGCRLENGVVITPTGFKAAYDQMAAGGWMGLDCDPEYGGQGMPYVMNSATGEMFVAANMAFNMYQGLTHGAYSAIHTHGSAEQKQTYLPKLVSGEWTGTMNLTEPHAGTDLGIMRTRAEPAGDGSYSITGTKIFISAGDHDLSQNVIHLVLAKAPGGGAGTKGVSLFIVPKFLVNEDGSLGARNSLSVGKLEEKMGIHGNATCVMNYDGAKGWLIGDLHKGMRAMFTMMNEARLGVGLQGYAQAVAAYENALTYAKERLQGRDVTGVKNPEGPADPIIVHPDIRRSLMDQKSFIEGARAFTFWGAHLIDRSKRLDDQDAEGLISLMTPVLKAFQTDKGFEMAVQAQQIFGGHGYIEEVGVSQFVRDARITMIYEGANGVQALDLVGRKLAQDGGKHVMAFFDMVKTFLKENEGDAELKAGFLDPLKAASKDLQSAGMFFMENGMKNPNAALSGSNDFVHLFGHVCLGLMWARMAKTAKELLAAGNGNADFLNAKIATGRYYMARQLPATGMHLARITSGAEPVMTLDVAGF